MPIWLDERLPELVEIDEPTRQQRRRVARRLTACRKCYRPLSADDVCFADGQDAHRSCAEHWNHQLLDSWDTLKAQDALSEEESSTLPNEMLAATAIPA